MTRRDVLTPVILSQESEAGSYWRGWQKLLLISVLLTATVLHGRARRNLTCALWRPTWVMFALLQGYSWSMTQQQWIFNAYEYGRRHTASHAIFEDFTAVKFQVTVFWVMIPCSDGLSKPKCKNELCSMSLAPSLPPCRKALTATAYHSRLMKTASPFPTSSRKPIKSIHSHLYGVICLRLLDPILPKRRYFVFIRWLWRNGDTNGGNL
jgi:hypothetical protein